MLQKIKDFFIVPSELLPEFWRVSFQHNRLSLLVICVMIFGMELFNMARVLFWSSSGLSTWNNRIYFGFYCALFLAAAAYLLLCRLFRGGPTRAALVLQFGSVSFFLLWHVCMNAYDLFRSSDAETGIYLTAVLGLSVFILMPARLAVPMHVLAYLLLMLLSGSLLSSGDRVNLTFTAIVALAVSLTNCRHHATMIAQRLEISRMNAELQVLAQRDALTGLLNKTAFQHRVEPHLHTEGAVLLIVDLDAFKAVNDRYGHPCGDFVLKETALGVEAAFPGALGIGRIGGDEFAVLVGSMDEAALEAAARTLIGAVSQIVWHGQRVASGCSVGGCRIGPSGASYERLYGEADRALYQAKARGKGQFSLVRLP